MSRSYFSRVARPRTCAWNGRISHRRSLGCAHDGRVQLLAMEDSITVKQTVEVLERT